MYSRGHRSLRDLNKVNRSVRLIRNNSDRFSNEAAKWVASHNLISPDHTTWCAFLKLLIVCKIYLTSVSALQCSF